MERELPPYRAAVTRPARPSIWPTLLIGAVLAAVVAGGVHLLAQTRQRWESNRSDRAERAAAFERDWQQQQARAAEREKARLESRQQPPVLPPVYSDNLRCLNGQLFRRLPNGWENLPGTTC